MFLLDTNIIIGILRKREDTLKKYKNLLENDQKIYITTYSLSEIHLGFNDQDFKQKFPEKLDIQIKLFNKMVQQIHSQNRILSLSIQDAKKLGEIFYNLKTKGKPIPVIDAIIGAIALSREFTVITFDQNHFNTLKELIPGFKVEYW